MTTNYEAWAKFNVDEEMDRIDERLQLEQVEKLRIKDIETKRKWEEKTANTYKQSAEILSAKAAVAALKAKEKARKEKLQQKNEKSIHNVEVTSPQLTTYNYNVKLLEADAIVEQQKHELIEGIIASKRSGDKLLESYNKMGKKFENIQQAQIYYSKSLQTTLELITLVDDIQKVNQIEQKWSDQASNQKCENTNCTTNTKNCRQNHEQLPSSCTKDANTEDRKLYDQVNSKLPEADDIDTITKMYLIENYIGLGLCHLYQMQLALAADNFKEVLLRDELNTVAWLHRGECFEKMDAPLIALLHYSRLSKISPTNEEAKNAECRVKDKIYGSESTGPDILTNGDKSLVEQCRDIQLLFQEASAIMLEGFYGYSNAKYNRVLTLIEQVSIAIKSEQNSLNVNLQNILKQLSNSCHLNIAKGLYELQKDLEVGVQHCEIVLKTNSEQPLALYHQGQLLSSQYKFEPALQKYTAAKAVLKQFSLNNEEKNLEKIEQVIDKCTFERGQYDMSYILAHDKKVNL